jgi:energy-coupling factor transport system ATP-binding protein
MDFVKSENLVYEYKIYNESENKQIGLRALKGVSLSIPEGQFVAILGHNGSGKSTFAKHINALLTPTEGVIYVNGISTLDEDKLWNIRQSAGMVFQNPDNQLIATLVEEDVAFGCENLGVPGDEIKSRVSKALATVNMGEYRHSAPSSLSGGQKQRIAIAGILAMHPRCIVLDEPTAMLDPVGRKEVIDTVMHLNRTEGITIVLITHYMEEAALADRVVVMDDGVVVMDDVPRKVFSQVDRMKSLYLDVPQATELMYELNKRDLNLKGDVLTIDEAVNELLSHTFTDKETESREPVAYTVPNEIIRLENVTHIYGRNTAFERIALDDVSFSIGKGEFIGLIGHTGSGKSTLISHLNALEKPDSGRVLIAGEDINGDKGNLQSLRQRVGLVFQYPEHQLFEATVYADVSFGPKNMGLDKDEIDKRVRESLALVGMDESFYEKSPFELSGGQKRRVAIAGVLAMKPEVLVLDEPAAGLDPYSRDEILNAVSNMHKELSLTVVLVSHSMEDISKYADRILVMSNGRVEMFDTVANVFKNADRLEKIGLAVPQITAIMRRLCEHGVKLPNDVYTIETAVEILSKALIVN